MKAIFTKYLPQTATKPARVRASDSDGNAVTVTYHGDCPYGDFTPYQWAVIELATRMKLAGKLAQGGLSNGGQVFVWVNAPDTSLLDTLCSVALNPAVKEHLPYGTEERVRQYLQKADGNDLLEVK